MSSLALQMPACLLAALLALHWCGCNEKSNTAQQLARSDFNPEILLIHLYASFNNRSASFWLETRKLLLLPLKAPEEGKEK